MYYITKSAISDHGVLWIGEDLDEGKERANYFASNHDDGHHIYCVMDFKEPKHNHKDGQTLSYCDWEDKSEHVYTGINTATSQP